jgi:hypothetical protein
MAIALIFGVAFAALCVWRTVRIINRKERWAKWTLAGVIALPILYPLSEGPVAWIWVHAVPDSLSPRFADFRLATYRPLNSLLAELPPRPPDRGKKMLHTFGEASRAQRLHWAYVRLWVSADETTERWSKDQRQRWGRYDR